MRERQGHGHRGARVAEIIRNHLTTFLIRNAEDARLAALTVTAVEMTGDLGLARIQVRSMVDHHDEAERRAILRQLQRLAPRLRRDLGPKLKVRRIPELRFSYDTGLDNLERVEQLLDEIHAEDAERRASRPDEDDASQESAPPSHEDDASPRRD